MAMANDQTKGDFNNGLATKVGSQRTTVTLTIASGQQVSAEAIDLAGYALIGIEMPAAFTGTTITFQTAVTEKDPAVPVGTYTDLYDSDDAQVSITVQAGRNYSLITDDLVALLPWRYVKLRSGSVEAAGRTLNIVLTS